MSTRTLEGVAVSIPRDTLRLFALATLIIALAAAPPAAADRMTSRGNRRSSRARTAGTGKRLKVARNPVRDEMPDVGAHPARPHMRRQETGYRKIMRNIPEFQRSLDRPRRIAVLGHVEDCLGAGFVAVDELHHQTPVELRARKLRMARYQCLELPQDRAGGPCGMSLLTPGQNQHPDQAWNTRPRAAAALGGNQRDGLLVDQKQWLQRNLRSVHEGVRKNLLREIQRFQLSTRTGPPPF